MKVIEDYIRNLRASWLTCDQKYLVRKIRNPGISDEEALKIMKAYSGSQGIYSKWMNETIIGKDRLRDKLLEVIDNMRTLGLWIPEPPLAVQTFLDGGEFPKG